MKPKQKEILINDIPKIATRLKTTKDILDNTEKKNIKDFISGL